MEREGEFVIAHFISSVFENEETGWKNCLLSHVSRETIERPRNPSTCAMKKTDRVYVVLDFWLQGEQVY
jgi:hypothetical protein